MILIKGSVHNIHDIMYQILECIYLEKFYHQKD